MIISGTTEGGRRAAATNKEKYGKDFYRRIAQKGGRNGHTGGFGSDKVGADGLTGKERAKIAGAKGGRKSTRLGIGNGEGKSAKRGKRTISDYEASAFTAFTSKILRRNQKTDTQ